MKLHNKRTQTMIRRALYCLYAIVPIAPASTLVRKAVPGVVVRKYYNPPVRARRHARALVAFSRDVSDKLASVDIQLARPSGFVLGLVYS